MELRKAEFSDLSAITAIYKDAKEALKAQGIDQWQDGYPNEESARADIENGTSYVLADESGVFATACLAFGHEPTYDAVYGGAWQAEGEYGFLHRVAVSGTRKRSGAASRFFEELKRQAEERDVKILRGDTHQDNAAMQRTMEKNGFCRRGTILMEDGSERIAYECLLETEEKERAKPQ